MARESLTKIERSVLERYPKEITHIRSEREEERFGVVLGAGVSKPIGFPSWDELVARIAAHPEVNGQHVISGPAKSLSATSKTQFLFHHYRSLILDRDGEHASAKFERKIEGQWRQVIHSCLYHNIPETALEITKKHPYLTPLTKLIAASELTVNYNFDDTIEKILIDLPNEQRSNFIRNFETVWNSTLVQRKGISTILHPNGFLPHNLLEYPSDFLVLSEDSFADQLIESMAGHQASLLHHYSRNTCVFVGLSLADGTLRHLLRQSAIINPGHVHYLIQWREKGGPRDVAIEKTIAESNFEVYNLITLFLDDDEIEAFFKLLLETDELLRREAEEIGVDTNYYYYISGAVGTGKTTAVSNLGSFKTYNEWSEPRLALLGKAWTELSAEETRRVDDWIIRQFYIKNCKLLDQKSGIHIVDRSPLDPLSFTPASERSRKAKSIKDGLSPGRSKRKACDGQLILLTGNPEELETRIIGRHKTSSADVIRNMQQNITSMYAGKNLTVIDTEGRSIRDVTKQILKEIFFDTYKPMNLSSVLEEEASRTKHSN